MHAENAFKGVKQGQMFMNPRFLFYVYKLRRNIGLSSSELSRLQFKQLKIMLKHAYDDVPFYHRKFRNAKIKPDDIETIDDLDKVPITTKSELQSSALSDIVAVDSNPDKCITRMTSGSTGMPLTLVADAKTVDFELALWTRTFLANGVRPWDKIGVLTDPKNFPRSGKLTQRLGISRRNYVSIFDGPEKQEKILEACNVDVIKGYPTSLALLAEHCKLDACKIRPRLIFTAAELLSRASRISIASAFGGELLDNYACIEFGLLSWECSEHMGYHINADSVILQAVRKGETVARGERGEIVCTSLVNHAMPLIRYKIGDVGVLSDESCSCGRALPLMKIVEGRTGDFLMATDGRAVSPIIFFPYPFESLEGIKQFRVVQEKRNKLIIQLVLRENFKLDPSLCGKATSELQKVFGEDMQVEFQVLKELATDSAKLRKIISNIPVDYREH